LLTAAPAAWADTADGSAAAAATPGMNANPNVETKISKDEAIAIAKKLLNISPDYKLQSINLNADWSYPTSSRAYWYLYFDKRVGDRTIGNLNVNIDANTGRVTNFGSYENDPDNRPSFPPKVDFAAAKKIADDWLSKMDGSAYSQLKYNDRYEADVKPPLDANVQYNFQYVRVVNGVPFPQDMVNVTVNGDGKITSYYSNWTEGASFESTSGIISKQDAEKAFKEKANPGLLYQIPYQSRDKKLYIAYTMETFSLNAKTGEWMTPSGAPMPQQGDGKPISDKPLGSKPAANLNLSKEEAIQRVEQKFKLPSGAKVQNASYNEYYNQESNEMVGSWNISWTVESKDDAAAKLGYGPVSVWANVNAKTGEVMNYNYYVPTYDPHTGKPLPVNPKITDEEAKAKAVDFVKNMLPYYAHELVYTPSYVPDYVGTDNPRRTIDFNFKHIVDGVSVGYNNVSVQIDRETGDVVNYYANFSLTKYPTKKPDVIPVDQAKDLLLSQYDIELAYVLPYNYYGPIPYEKMMAMKAAGDPLAMNDSADKQEAKLVYQLVSKYQREPFFLDAVSGTWKSMTTGEPISLVKEKVTDIDGHWAQEALQLMLDYQALEVVDGKVNPDQAITKGEMVKMLVIAMNGGHFYAPFDVATRQNSFADVTNESKYFVYVETALDRRLINKSENFHPEQKMTRDDMALLVIRALGYDKLSQFDAMFNKSFSDVNEVKHAGAAAMAVGLGIMSVQDGKFNPNKEVTRAEAASAFYRYLQKRSILQDNLGPYYY